jgi:biopolymer transport protein ExbD
MKKILTILMVTAMMLSVCVLPALAEAQELVSASMPYDTYVYDYDGNPVITPHAYVPSFVVDGEDMGVGALSSPSDLEVDKDGNIYIVDMEYTVDMDALEGQVAESATKS